MSDLLPSPEGNRGATPTWGSLLQLPNYRRKRGRRGEQPADKASGTMTGQSGGFYAVFTRSVNECASQNPRKVLQARHLSPTVTTRRRQPTARSATRRYVQRDEYIRS